MNNVAALLLFITTVIFAGLYLGAKRDVERRDEVIIEMRGMMSAAQKAELQSRFETRRFVLDPRE